MTKFSFPKSFLGVLIALGACISEAEAANPKDRTTTANSIIAEASGRPKSAGKNLVVRSGIEPLMARTKGFRPQRSVVLPPLSTSELEATNRKQPSLDRGRVRIGLARSFDTPTTVSRETISDSEWTVLPNGSRIWALEVVSPGALGVRIHLQSLSLPQGVHLAVYDADKPPGETD